MIIQLIISAGSARAPVNAPLDIRFFGWKRLRDSWTQFQRFRSLPSPPHCFSALTTSANSQKISCANVVQSWSGQRVWTNGNRDRTNISSKSTEETRFSNGITTKARPTHSQCPLIGPSHNIVRSLPSSKPASSSTTPDLPPSEERSKLVSLREHYEEKLKAIP